MEKSFYNYSDFLYKRKQGDCKITFEMGKLKNGKETIYKHTPTLSEIAKGTETDYEEIKVTDIWKEKRKGKTDSIVGTSIVNILNASNILKKFLKEYKVEIEKIHPNKIEELYNYIVVLKEKYNLNEIDNNAILELYYKITDEISAKQEYYMFNEDKIISSKNILEQLKPSENKEYNSMFNFLKEVYSLDIEEILGFSGQNSLICDILENKINKYTSMQTLFSTVIVDSLRKLMNNIKELIGDYAVFINISIYKFLIDLQNVYIFRESELYKMQKYNILYNYQFEQPNNTFYNKMRTYLENNADENSTSFIYDITIIFINSLISDIEYIKFEIDKKYLKDNNVTKLINALSFNESELPRVLIDYRTVTKNFYGEKLKTPKSVPYMYSYYITTLLELYDVSIYHLHLDNRELHKCKNCSRYFITDTKNSEIFCKRIDLKNKGKKTRYCYEVGQEYRKSKNITSIKDLHHTLYNRLYRRWKKYENEEDKELEQKYKKEFDDYKQKYEQLRTVWRNKEITKKQLKAELLKELEKDNKRIEKGNKKEKRNRHYLTSEDIIKRNQ